MTLKTYIANHWTRPGGFKEVLKIAYPLIISTGSFTIMQFCDRMFLAWHSAVSIQAALPAGILCFALLSVFFALAGYTNTFVAQYYGAKEYRGCSRSTVQGVILSLASWPILLLLIPVGRYILGWINHPPDVLASELTYFTILMAGSVSVLLSAAISSFFTGRGDTLTNMIATIAGNVVNIVLDYILIFGKFGLPSMGIKGAAIATVISGFIQPGILFILYFSKKIDVMYHTRQTLRYEADLMKRMVRFGLPSAVHLFVDIGAFATFVLLMGRIGPDALAASNIAFSINNLAFMPLIGMSIAASILVGQYQGRKDSSLAQRAGWTSLKIGCIYMTIIGLSFILFPKEYLSLFADRGTDSLALVDILPAGRYLLLMMGLWGLFDAANLILSGALRGAGDTKFVMIYSAAMAWGFWMLGEIVIIFMFKMGLFAAWIWMMLFVIIVASGFFLRFKSDRWKNIEVLDRQEPFMPSRPGAEAQSMVE